MFPSKVDLARLDQRLPLRDGSAPEIEAIAERYSQHRAFLEQCYYSQYEAESGRCSIMSLC